MPSPSAVFSFLRRFLIACVAVVVITGAGVAAGQQYNKQEFAKSRTIHIPDGILTQVGAGQPANYLLIGSDSRADETPAEKQAYGSAAQVTGARSDVMMVLHVEPAQHTGMLVSFPRDLVVTIPGHSGHNLLNAAFSFGGPALTIQTIEQNFPPLKINHYLEVDFTGFKSIVDAIGHVNIWFPTPANDEFTGLHIPKAGCVSLNGDQALAYARSRHYNIPENLQHPAPWVPHDEYSNGQVVDKVSPGWIEDGLADLDRIPRQQYFLRTLSQAAIDKTGSDPFAIAALADAIFKHLGHDQNLKLGELNAVASTFRDLKPSKIEMMTLPITEDPAWPGHVIAKYPDANPVISQLANFPTPAAGIPRPLAPKQVKVRVVNGSGLKGAAGSVLTDMVAAGFKSAGSPEDADRSDYKTQVRYAPGKFLQGYTVAYALGTQNLVEAASAKNTLGGDALVIVGTDYESLPHNFKHVTSTSTGDHAHDRAAVDQACRICVDDDDHGQSVPSERRHPVRARRPRNRRRVGGLSEQMSLLSPRAFLHRLLVAFLVVVVLTSVAIAAAYAQAENKVSHIAKAPIDSSVLQRGDNFLLIGSDSRAFVDSSADARAFGSAQVETGQRSDTIMVAHVDPGKGTAILVSFPRDLWVAIPGLGHAKINAAFNAGPQRVIETIEQDFDIPISHYLQIDFEGFRKMVNAIGTIPIYFPAPARDLKSGLSIPRAGCVNLNGDQALAFVRSRYYQSLQNGQWMYDPTSDLGRIRRQQYFLRTLAQQTLHAAESKPWRANSIADSMLSDLQRDPELGFSSLRSLAYAFRQPGNVETVTLPTHRQFFEGQDALALDSAAAAPLLTRLREVAKPTTNAQSKAPSNVKPSSVRLVVLNGSGRSGLGASVLASMRTRGYAAIPPARNADRSDYTVTEVRYAPGAHDKGRLVLAALGGAGKLVAATSSQTGGADVALVLGADFRGLTPTTAAPQSSAAATGTSASPPTTVAPVGC